MARKKAMARPEEPRRKGFASQGFVWEAPEGVWPVLRSVSNGESMLWPRVSRMSHPLWVIDYCFHSGEDYRVGSERQAWLPRRANTAHLYSANMLYWERVVGEPLVRKSAAMLFEVQSARVLERLIDPASGYAEIEDPAGEIGALMRQAAGVGHQRGTEGFWEAQGLFCRVLDLLLSSQKVHGLVFRYEPSNREPKNLAGRVDAYIRESLPGRLSLERIAKAMKISPSALSHGYKAQTGKAVMTAAMEMRLEMSKPLLLQGQRLKTVADNLGFSDAFHLSKQFKRHVGISPRAFVGRRR